MPLQAPRSNRVEMDEDDADLEAQYEWRYETINAAANAGTLGDSLTGNQQLQVGSLAY